MVRLVSLGCKVLGRSTAVLALALVPSPAGFHTLAHRAPRPSAAASSAALQAPFPSDFSRLWLVPTEEAKRTLARSGAFARFAAGIRNMESGRFAEAMPLLSTPELAATPLADYGVYSTAIAQLKLGRTADARETLDALAKKHLAGYLAEAVPLQQAEVAEALNDPQFALAIYERLAQTKTTTPEDVWMRLARAAEASQDRGRASQAYARVYYEFPLSDRALEAQGELQRLGMSALPGMTEDERYRFDLGRAERLFGARKYTEARSAFERIRPMSDDDRELVSLRLAESDNYLRRYRAARDGLAPFQERASRLAEARFFYLTATRELGDHDEYVRLARTLVDQFPDSPWAEETLNNLATHYILVNDDPQADAVFRELSARFPSGRYAERASWKAGWWSYKNGRFAESASIFESAASAYSRSDYRPSYLYWAARARDRLGDPASANDRYAVVTTDYLNSYYGRLATRILRDRKDRRAEGVRAMPDTSTEGLPKSGGSGAGDTDLPPNADLIRLLLSLDLDEQAADEMVYAQRVWGESPVVQATLAWTYSHDGDLRRGISAMKKAYPQYMAAGGEQLPPDLLKVVFPLNYWSLIRRNSLSYELDPYMIAALIAQESTFVPDIRSHANAIGLMQLVPATGRRYARTLKLRRYTTAQLETPETNVKLGTAYFSDLRKKFGGDHYALASYNAGEYRVARWIAERPGLAQDEFIDDIPFPETQNYVKKILGTSEDYRRLYAGEADDAAMAPAPRAPAPAAVKTPAVKKPATTRPTTTSTKKSATKKPVASKSTTKTTKKSR